MAGLRPGWLVALCALVLIVSAWLPWLTTHTGRANAVGGKLGAIAVPPPGFGVGQLIVLLSSTLIVAGAMTARRLWYRSASIAALSISVILAALLAWYYQLYVHTPVSVGYGFYIAVGAALVAVLFSVPAVAFSWSARAGRAS